MDFRPEGGLARGPGKRGGKRVGLPQRRGRGGHGPPHHHDPALDARGGQRVVGVDDVGIGHRVDGPRRAGIVDEPGRVRDRAAGNQGGGSSGQGGQPGVAGGEPAHGPVGVRRQHRQSQTGGDPGETRQGIDPHLPGKGRIVHGLQGRRQHRVAARFQGLGKGVVIGGRARFGKDHVQDHGPGSGLAQPIQKPGMQASRPGPGQPDFLQRGLVHGHHQQIRRPHRLPNAKEPGRVQGHVLQGASLGRGGRHIGQPPEHKPDDRSQDHGPGAKPPPFPACLDHGVASGGRGA